VTESAKSVVGADAKSKQRRASSKKAEEY
jgi:hypothetical protein